MRIIFVVCFICKDTHLTAINRAPGHNFERKCIALCSMDVKKRSSNGEPWSCVYGSVA